MAKKRSPRKPSEIVAIHYHPKFDGYSFVTSIKSGTRNYVMMLGTNSIPESPNMGVSQWGDGTPGRHLGRKIKWSDVPLNVRKHVVRRFSEG